MHGYKRELGRSGELTKEENLMKKKFLQKTALLLALIFALTTISFAAETDYGEKLDEALALYHKYGLYSDDQADYVREALIELFEEDESLFYKFINKIYGKNDRYSKYMTPEAYDTAYNMDQTMVGIGVVISISEDGYLVVDDVSAGPAGSAGIKKGDRFIAVDGVNVDGYFPAELGNLIRGEEGTHVKIDVLRGEEKLSFNVRRETVRISDVSSEILEDKIGYIKLNQFGGINSFIDFMKAYDEFAAKEVNTIILDLRNNPGGSFDCFVNLMDNIIPEKDVPYAMTWQAEPYGMKIYFSEGYGWEFNKFVILVNGQTASAAEVMAGSLRDLGYATIVGEKSFGKGMGQIHFETKDGDEAIVTTLEIKLPVSGGYDGVGLTPDHEVKMKLTPYKLPYLTPLKEKNDASNIKTDNVKAIEERLLALGYFYGTPDSDWDNRTVRAVNAFCRDNNIQVNNSVCKWSTIEKIDAETKKLTTKFVAEDAPFERALEIAREYAAKDEKAKCVDQSLIDFRR